MFPKKKSVISIIFLFIIYILLGNAIVHLANSYDYINDLAIGNKIDYIKIANEFTSRITINNFFNISHSESVLKFVLIYSCFSIFIILYLKSTRHNLLSGKEHGSAGWSSHKKIKKLKDKLFSENMIFTQTEYMSMDGWKTKKNNNTIVIGGSGSGKSQYFVIPNILQMHSSFVVTDPKGELLRNCGKALEENGYKIVVLNLWELDKSSYYNPFVYLRPGRDEDIMTLINTLMTNTDGDKRGNASDPFWEKAEQLFLQAIFYYIIYELPYDERHIPMALELIRCAEIREDEAEFESDLDIMFKLLEEEKGSDHIAVVQYKHFKVAAGKTAKSIIISASARLSPYNIPALAEISKKDELALSKIGEEKTALFVIIPSTNPTYNFVASIMYTQLLAELDYIANFKYKGRLPIKVRFLLDEFANVGKIPRFEIILAYARSLGVGIAPIFQSLSQLKEMYKDSWETIIDCCDSFLFLGSQGSGTAEYVSKKLGKATIETKTTSRTFSKQGSSSENYNLAGRELMTMDELISDLDDEHCILFIKGMRPFFSKKYNPLKHPNFMFTKRADDKNEYIHMKETVHGERDLEKEDGKESTDNDIADAIQEVKDSIIKDLDAINIAEDIEVLNDMELLDDDYYEEEEVNEVEEVIDEIKHAVYQEGEESIYIFNTDDENDMTLLMEKLNDMELLEDDYYDSESDIAV